MGQQQSKEELLYQQVSYGNVDGIKSLCREGAGLEYVDKEGKTPLILACMNHELFNVAKTLIELGANVNAYRPGRNGGTPLHHAAKRGLENTVKLLTANGANPLLMNDDCQTPLEVARSKGFVHVVRAIEDHICLFSGWLREFYGLGFVEVLAPQWFSRNVWVVVLPTGSRNLRQPFKLELAMYSNLQEAQPRTLIALWKANLEDMKFHRSDPSVTIVDNTNISRGRRRRRARRRPQTLSQTRIKLAPLNENDKKQLQWFCDACKGIPQAMRPPAFLRDTQAPIVQATAPPPAEDLELAMAINASIQSAMAETSTFENHPGTEATASTSWDNTLNSDQGALGVPAATPSKSTSNEWVGQEAGPSSSSTEPTKIQNDGNLPAGQTVNQAPDSVPSAPPIDDAFVDNGSVHYPSIDSGPVEMSSSSVDKLPTSADDKKDGSSSCVICLDAPVEGACIPCGHMVGCMTCLKEIKAKKWGCPVCRTKIDQVIKLYAV